MPKIVLSAKPKGKIVLSPKPKMKFTPKAKVQPNKVKFTAFKNK